MARLPRSSAGQEVVALVFRARRRCGHGRQERACRLTTWKVSDAIYVRRAIRFARPEAGELDREFELEVERLSQGAR